MNWKRFLIEVIRCILATVPILGSFYLIWALHVRKKYWLRIIPFLCVLSFFLAVMSIDRTEGKINRLQSSLSQTIENTLFSYRFLPNEKLTIEQFSGTIRDILSGEVEFDPTLLNDNSSLQEKYQEVIDKYYGIYETAYTTNLSAGVSLHIPFTEKKEIRAEIESFCAQYADLRYADSFFLNFLELSFFLLWLGSIPLSIYIFYKYPSVPKIKFSETTTPSRSMQQSRKEIDIDQILSRAEPQSSPPPTHPSLVKINYVSESDIRNQLGLNAIHAKRIIEERATNGDFLDFANFVKRVRISERICDQFKDRLDFSTNNQPTRPYGRVFEI
jgi:hypothetical protein